MCIRDSIESISEIELSICEILGLHREDNCIVQTSTDEVIYCCEPISTVMKRIKEATETKEQKEKDITL